MEDLIALHRFYLFFTTELARKRFDLLELYSLFGKLAEKVLHLLKDFLQF